MYLLNFETLVTNYMYEPKGVAKKRHFLIFIHDT